MTYITGYTNRKGPYITNNAGSYGGTGVNKNDSSDCLIWSISVINTGGTAEETLEIWDNAASTDFTNSNNRHDNYRILSVSLDADSDADGASDKEGWLHWDFETPILARNGFYGLGGTNIDWTVWYTLLPQSNPYDTTTGANVTIADKAKRASLVPELICCKMESMGGASEYSKWLSTKDCEIWGIWTWNTLDSGVPMMLRVKNESSTIMSLRMGLNDQNNAAILKQFKIPMYSKGGIQVISKNESGVDTHGVNCSVLFREFEHDGRALSPSGKL